MIHKGTVKLYAENNFSFMTFNLNESFGDTEVMLNLKRQGTARPASDALFLYKIARSKLLFILHDYPHIKRALFQHTLQKNEKLLKLKLKCLKKNPIFGVKNFQKEAVDKLKGIISDLHEKFGKKSDVDVDLAVANLMSQ